MPQEQMLRTFEFRNLLDEWPGTAEGGKGDSFPINKARLSANLMRPSLIGRDVIFVGMGVATAFNVSIPALNTWTNKMAYVGRVACVAHPSGVNRYWNNQEHVEVTRRFFKQLKKDYARTT